MLGGALTGAGFAHPGTIARTNANATRARVSANFSGSSVVRGNFAADQFDLLRPRIGFRNWPQYKLVETLRNVFAEARDHAVARAVHGAFEIGFRASAHRREHRAHFSECALARRRDATEQD